MGATTPATMLLLLSLLCAAASKATAHDTRVPGRECAKSLLFQESLAQPYTTYTRSVIKSIPAQGAVQDNAPPPVTLYTASPNYPRKRIYDVHVIGDEFFWLENTGNTTNRLHDAWFFRSGSVSAGGVTSATAARLSQAIFFDYSRWDYPENAQFAIDTSTDTAGVAGERYFFTTGDLAGIKVVGLSLPEKRKVTSTISESGTGSVAIDSTVTPPLLYWTERHFNTHLGQYVIFIRRGAVVGNRTRLVNYKVQTIYKAVDRKNHPIGRLQLDTHNRRLYVLHVNEQQSFLAVHDISLAIPQLIFKRPIDHDFVKYFKIDVYSSPPVMYALILGVSLFKAQIVPLDGTDPGGSSDTIIAGPKVQLAYQSLAYYNVYSVFDIYYDPECVAAALAP